MKKIILLIIIGLCLLIFTNSCAPEATKELIDTQAIMVIKEGSIDCFLESSYLKSFLNYTLENTSQVETFGTVLKNPEFKETTIEYVKVFIDDTLVKTIESFSSGVLQENIDFPEPLPPGGMIDIRIEYGVSGLVMPEGKKETWRWILPYLDATALKETAEGIPITIVTDREIHVVSSVPLGFEKQGNKLINRMKGLTTLLVLEVTDEKKH